MQARKFYYLNDAVKLITEKTNQTYSTDDLIALGIDGKLSISISASNWHVKYLEKKINFQFNDYCGMDSPMLKAAIQSFHKGSPEYFAPTVPVRTIDLQKYSIFNDSEFTVLYPASNQSCPFSITDLGIKNEFLTDFIDEHISLSNEITAHEHPCVEMPVPTSNNSNIFKKNKTGTWDIKFDNLDPITMPEYMGFNYIQQLLMNQEKEISAVNLNSIYSTAKASKSAPICGEIISEGLDTSKSIQNYEQSIDNKALSQYRQKITELKDDIEEAQEFNDIETESSLREALDFIQAEIYKNTSNSGKPKNINAAEKKVKDAVSRNIRNAISKLHAKYPELASHLTAHISTGKECTYSPDKKVHWKFD